MKNECMTNLCLSVNDCSALIEALLSLEENRVEYVLECCERKDWNAVEFKQEEIENILIALYVMGKISKSIYLFTTQIVLTFKQFNQSVMPSQYAIATSNVEVLDLNHPSNIEHKERVLASSRGQASKPKLHQFLTEYATEEAQVICCQLTDKEAPFFIRNDNMTSPRVKNRQQKTPEEIIVRESKEARDCRPGKPRRWANVLIVVESGPVVFDFYTKRLYILSVLTVERLCELHGHPIAMMPVLGATSAEDMKVMRLQQQHPVLVYNDLVDNNLTCPDRIYCDQLFGLLHDLYHAQLLSTIPKPYRNMFLDLDTYCLQFFGVADNSRAIEGFSLLIESENQVFKNYYYKLCDLLLKYSKATPARTWLTFDEAKKYLELKQSMEKKRPFLDQEFTFDEKLDPNFMAGRYTFNRLELIPMNAVNFMFVNYLLFQSCCQHAIENQALPCNSLFESSIEKFIAHFGFRKGAKIIFSDLKFAMLFWQHTAKMIHESNCESGPNHFCKIGYKAKIRRQVRTSVDKEALKDTQAKLQRRASFS